jgi:glycosyltransferase involved in cell wall biosynthesis
MRSMTRAPSVSVVIPAFNEEQNIAPIYLAIRSALREPETVEIIFVDDGSTDATAQCVRRLRAQDSRVRLIRFGRNFGHQAALAAGLEAAGGDAVITLDCDLQHPPELLPRLVEAWRGGAKVVQMVRTQTEGENFWKTITSNLFYRTLNMLSERPVVAGAADYQLLDRSVVDAVLRFRDRYPFVRGLVSWLGFPATRIEYIAPRRAGGESGYTVGKMLRLSINAVTGMTSKPLRLAFYLGLLTATLSLAYGVFAIFAMLQGRTVPGWTSVTVVMTFLGAVQLISLGIVGEYIARIYEQARGVPRFVIVEQDDGADKESQYESQRFMTESG